MYRDGRQPITENQVNFVLNHGALGDVICSLPAIIAGRRAYRADAMKMTVWAPPYLMELLAHLLKPYGEFTIKDFTTFPMRAVEREGWGQGAVAINQMPFNTHTRNRVHMVDYAFGCLLDSKPEDMAERNYPTLAPVGEVSVPNAHAPWNAYVVIPVGATSENKTFRASVMRPIIDWLVETGYTPVIVGTKTIHTHAIGHDGESIALQVIHEADQIDMAKVVDMRDKTTLLELRDICAHAAAVIGVDGGTLHLAGTTDVPIVYALTTSHPKHRYIAREGDPSHKIRYIGPRNLECANCQTNWRLLFNHDFRLCFYGDNLCTERLHPDDFINGMKELGL